MSRRIASVEEALRHCGFCCRVIADTHRDASCKHRFLYLHCLDLDGWLDVIFHDLLIFLFGIGCFDHRFLRFHRSVIISKSVVKNYPAVGGRHWGRPLQLFCNFLPVPDIHAVRQVVEARADITAAEVVVAHGAVSIFQSDRVDARRRAVTECDRVALGG